MRIGTNLQNREVHPSGNQVCQCGHDAAEGNDLRLDFCLAVENCHGEDPGHNQGDQGDDGHFVDDSCPAAEEEAEQGYHHHRDGILQRASALGEGWYEKCRPDDTQQQTLSD